MDYAFKIIFFKVKKTKILQINNPIKLKNGLWFATVKKLNDAPFMDKQNMILCGKIFWSLHWGLLAKCRNDPFYYEWIIVGYIGLLREQHLFGLQLINIARMRWILN